MSKSFHAIAATLIVALSAAGCTPRSAARRDVIEFTGSVVVGFPAAPAVARNNFASDMLGKDGTWMPVSVQLTCNGEYPGPARLIVEAADSDEIPTRYTVPIPQLTPGQTEYVIGYARPGGRNDNLTLTVVSDAGRELAQLTMPRPRGMEPAQMLYVAIGSALEAAPLPGLATTPEEGANIYGQAEARTLLAQVAQVEQMPTAWFGYDGADAVFLTTGDRDRMTALVNERTGRKAALAEWVRRGGNLVVSVGKNEDLLTGMSELNDLLPMQPVGTAELDLKRLAWKGVPSGENPLGVVTIAKLAPKPSRPAVTLASGPPSADGKETPLVVQSPYGWGRVTLVAFELEGKPLANWQSKGLFWSELASRAGPRVPQVDLTSQNARTGFSQPIGEDSAFAELVRKMETFPGVPVVSFGWVALFILIYIVIVGPLDYLFLKKVVKRMELTWVTFPLTVLIVSAAAYYAAYAIKGSDLRINKYDLVDIDVAGKQLTGRTWYTLFSPRIQNYRLSVEPAQPLWVPDGSDDPSVMVSWSGQTRQARQSLFRRSYDYLPKAAGLDGVPIQVWSTKGFEARWFAAAGAGRTPIEADLRVTPGGRTLIGDISHHFGGPLEDAFIIYASGQRDPSVVPLGTLMPDAPKAVSAQEPQPFSGFLREPSTGDPADEAQPALRRGFRAPKWMPVTVLFQELAIGPGDQPKNASLRGLDMSWRLTSDHLHEAILVGYLPAIEGAAEEVNASPTNPARLWIGAFPGKGVARPAIDGKLHQATCIRAILPVRSTNAPRH